MKEIKLQKRNTRKQLNIKIKSKQNPYNYQKRINISSTSENEAKEILKDLDFEIINTSGNSDLYYFELKHPSYVLNVPLPKGEFLLKIIKPRVKLTEKELKIQQLLSDEDLIPEIYFANKYLMVQQYVDAIDLKKLYLTKTFTKSERDDIYQKILIEYDKYRKLGLLHGDLKFANILIGKNRVYLIDPRIGFSIRVKETKEELEELDVQLLKIIKEWDRTGFVDRNNDFGAWALHT